MLPVESLIKAGIPESSNQLLKDLWAAVLEYNKATGVGATIAKFETIAGRASPSHAKASQLQSVMLKAGAYLTSKPPQPRRKNESRWDAIAELAEAASREAEALGVKLVTGPADMRNVTAGGHGNPSVWLEVIDPMHRDHNYLSEAYQDWLTDSDAIAKKSSFWGHGNAALTAETRKYYDNEAEYSVFYDTMARSLAEFDPAGRLVDSHGDAIDTLAMYSEHTGQGWGIFVCDTKRRLFVSNHRADDQIEMIRHTTMAAGAPVLGAGEIVVQKGRIRALSNETGHYQLPYKTFLKFICTFAQVPDQAVVKVFAKEEGEPSEVAYAAARDIRAVAGEPTKVAWKTKDWAMSALTIVGW